MIACESVSKTYRIRDRLGWFRRGPARAIPALHEVSLSIEQGEIVGLLGPNGAGKTTLLKILCTLVLPDAGRAHVGGFDVACDARAARMAIGFVPASDRSLHWKLTARENLALYGGLYNLSRSTVRSRSHGTLANVGLADFVDVPVEKFSTGMRKRLMLARALLHNPAVLLLDEPGSGLDVLGKREMWTSLRQAAAEHGVTTLIATHDMEEAEVLPERLLLIDRGTLRADGTATDLRRRAGREDQSLGDAFLALTGSSLEDSE
ncbi:MAG: ABC transporter ATP-binding protein [Actinomycetota bacterium]